MLQRQWTWLLCHLSNRQTVTICWNHEIFSSCHCLWGWFRNIETWVNNTVIYQSSSITLTVLLQGFRANNLVISCDMFTRVRSNVTVGRLVRWSRVAGSIPCRKVLKLYFSQLHAPGLVWKSRCHSTYMLPYRIFHLIYPSVNAKCLLLLKD